jgi:hypothetical protein
MQKLYPSDETITGVAATLSLNCVGFTSLKFVLGDFSIVTCDEEGAQKRLSHSSSSDFSLTIEVFTPFFLAH